MDKKEILEKNKKLMQEDEGKVYTDNRARSLGVTVMIGLIAVLIIYNLFKGLESNNLQAILWTFIGMEAFYKYRFAQDKKFLLTCVCGLIAAVCFLLTYLIQTW